MLGANIKVHFAGCEQLSWALAVKYGGGHYLLWTCYPFVAKQLGLNCVGQILKPQNQINVPSAITNMVSHDILDSGLFTLMFGSGKGKVTERLLEQWFEVQTDFINTNKLKAACVEIDCQRVLNAKKAWEFRTRFRDALPNNRQINVFHLPDGKKGLDRLIEFSHYIAISVPEWRLFKRSTYQEDVVRLASYIKNKKPEIDIHMLGCTEQRLLKRLAFCTSSDSTSWQSAIRYGSILGNHIKSVKTNRLEENNVLAKTILDALSIQCTQTNFRAVRDAITSVQIFKAKYCSLVGSQD